MNHKHYSVLVFDSGVGGLSITQTLHKRLSNTALHYLSDNAAFPYGTKDSQFLVERTTTVLQSACRLIKPDLIVIACNTASTLALPALREVFSMPIVGVVPAIKPAAHLSKSKVIGLLATPGTISRPYTQQLVDDFASECKVVKLGSSFLVDQAECKLRGDSTDKNGIVEEVRPFLTANVDTVVMACTHFPLLKDELTLALPSVNYWVDSAEAIAKRVEYLLSKANISNNVPTQSTCYFTKNDPSNEYLRAILSTLQINRLATL